MDRSNLESCNRVHQSEPWLRPLLRGVFRGRVQRGSWACVRAGIRLQAMAPTNGDTATLDAAETRVREFDVRSLPRIRADRVPEAGLRSHGQGGMAHISGAYEAP